MGPSETLANQCPLQRRLEASDFDLPPIFTPSLNFCLNQQFYPNSLFSQKKKCQKVLCNTLGSGSALEQSFQALPLKVRNTEILSSPAPLSVYPTRYMAP